MIIIIEPQFYEHNLKKRSPLIYNVYAISSNNKILIIITKEKILKFNNGILYLGKLGFFEVN